PQSAFQLIPIGESSAPGGVNDRVAGLVPKDGYNSDAPMKFFESTVGWVQPLATESPQIVSGVFQVGSEFTSTPINGSGTSSASGGGSNPGSVAHHYASDVLLAANFSPADLS